MKTLKERVGDLKKEIKQRIIHGDFEVLKIEDHQSDGYYNIIHISIDGLEFRFSVSKCKTFLSQHESPVIIDWDGYGLGELKHLYGPIEAMQVEFKQKQLKKLQDEIREIQAK